jgi:hypothetical protein
MFRCLPSSYYVQSTMLGAARDREDEHLRQWGSPKAEVGHMGPSGWKEEAKEGVEQGMS